MAGLPWLPKSVLDQTKDWSFTNTVSSAMGSLKDMGQQIMAPIGQQIAAAMPAPPPLPEIKMPEVQVPEVQPFTLPSLESWGMGVTPRPQTAQEPLSIDRGPQTAPSAAAAPTTPGAASTGGFSLPGPEAWGMAPIKQAAGTVARSIEAVGQAASAAVSSSAPTDVNAYLKQAAMKAGIDPAQVLAVMGKEGPTGWGSVGRFDTGTSFGPLQLHYSGGSNPQAGMGDDFTRDTGIDLRRVDPKTPEGIAAHQRAVDYALDRLSKTGDYREWYGADPALGSRFTKVNRVAPVAAPAVETRPSPATTGPEGVPTAVADGAGWRETWGKDLTPNQINETLNVGMSWDAALATCGIAASVAFARANGRTPTFKEALDLAKSTGEWNAEVGMTRGTAGQLALLKKLGVDASARPINEAEVAQTVTAGKPVQINAHGSGGHFYVAQDYDPQTKKFNFGNSAAILKRSNGNTWYRLDELPSLGVGTPSEAIYLGAT